jgi:hypothetical protein
MAQNIYDNEEFFEGYARLPHSAEGLKAAPEWPALPPALALDAQARRTGPPKAGETPD